MRALYLAPYAPDRSATHAGGQFLFRYLDGLSHHVELQVFCPDTDENRRADTGNIAVTFIPTRQVGRRHLLVRRALLGLPGDPAFVAGLGRNEQFRSDLSRADVVEIHWAQYLPALRLVRTIAPEVPVVAFEHDVVTQSLARARRHGPWKRRLLLTLASLTARRSERRLLDQCDMVFVFSRKDAELLSGLGVTAPVHVVRPAIPRPAQPADLDGSAVALFIGAMWRVENQDAARVLVDQVWPAARARASGRLVIAGADPPAWLSSQGADDIVVTGFVEDLDELLAHATVFVAPLRQGAGVKFKVLEAMAFGLPVVTTPVGAEGILEEAGRQRFACVSDDPAELTDAVVRCLQDADHRHLIGRAARQWFTATYDFPAEVLKVVGRYRALADAPEASPEP